MNANFKILDKKAMNSIKGGLLIEHITYNPYPVSDENEDTKEEESFNGKEEFSNKEITIQ